MALALSTLVLVATAATFVASVAPFVPSAARLAVTLGFWARGLWGATFWMPVTSCARLASSRRCVFNAMRNLEGMVVILLVRCRSRSG